MVRTIDGDERRRVLAEAVWRIVRRDGLAAASVRTVAAESGLSTGSVRHFFTTQHELLEFAMRQLFARVAARIAESAAIGDPAERALAVLGEMMPLTDVSRDEAVVHFDFVVHSRLDPAFEAITQESFALIRNICRQVVEMLREHGRLHPDVDVEASATELAALVDGLTVRLLFAPDALTPDQAREAVRRHLDRESP